MSGEIIKPLKAIAFIKNKTTHYVAECEPEDKLGAVLYYRDLENFFTELADNARAKATLGINEAVNEGYASDKWDVVPHFADKNTSEVDYDLVKEENRGAWNRAHTMTAADMVKALGEDEVRRKVICLKGLDWFFENSKITIGNLKEQLTKEEQEKYIKKVKKQEGYDIIPKQPALSEAKQ